ncbi:MAG: DUF2892 domain-containing protein [Candidatus Saganbacteria bacterium]|nr:DUF2892 domain-containing protein [Candidatus Saganbacteria bacterium]
MLKNLSNTDRIIRLVIAVLLAAVCLSGAVSGIWAVVLWIVAAIALVTSAIGYCGLYHLLGFSTIKK